MIVHRFAKHYPAVFAVSKAISITLAGCGLFSQKCRDFHRGGEATGWFTLVTPLSTRGHKRLHVSAKLLDTLTFV